MRFLEFLIMELTFFYLIQRAFTYWFFWGQIKMFAYLHRRKNCR